MSHLLPLEVISRYPAHDYTLRGLFESRAQQNSSKPFVVFRGHTRTWGEFYGDIAAAASMLVSKGVKKGERVAIMATNSDAHVLLLFALARIGAIMVPVNPEFNAAEARYVMTHAGVTAIACSTDTLNVAKEASAEIEPQPWFIMVDEAIQDLPLLYDLLPVAPDVTLPLDVTADDVFAIIYSSGTTGFPKGVMHSQRNFVLSGERQVERVQLQPDDHYLCILPMFHINALFYSVAGSVTAGAQLIIVPRFSASEFWKQAEQSGATVVNVIMAVATILVRRPRSEFMPAHKLRLISGAPWTQEAVEVFHREFGIAKLVEGFGMTEMPGAFSNPYNGEHMIGTMGMPGQHPDRKIVWTQARVVDDDGNDVPDGVPGELVVKIPTMMKGYYRDPEQTAAAFREGWFLTGDFVKRDSDGCFHFVARKKDIIRRRGENIAGAELDRIMALHPAVSEAAAIAVDAELGEDEIMAVVVKKSDHPLTAKEIRDWCAARLAAHKVPRFVIFLDALPHTPTHKVAKYILKQDKSLRGNAVDFQKK